ncbi:MBL fold metallo-hydrolase [Roseomonas sp. GC11]|uniref:AidB family quorum-quenching N-acyl homoserine lactonase n=1 Tax=Roseomonas sp. GC11 TaxID=2950546 RepID=UPI00210BFB43|nr:MBL fold metallo-hydrolase [Roseomonas sp. GC11]MCQ4159639.1 MBL fold metallo-hydrolase [Roseomonas sp. GC11]
MDHPTRRAGVYEVTLLADGIFKAPPEAVIHTRAAPGWRVPPGDATGSNLRLAVNCFLLRGPGGVTLVDSGCGTAWGESFGQARTALAALGITPEQVERVLLTHIHSDHVLGLLAGEGAYFPRAEVLAPETDLAFFTSAAARAATPKERQGGFDMATKIAAAYGPRLRGVPAGEVMPGILALPLPGHTPGHTGYRIDDLLLWGDTLHITALQPAEPEIGMVFDMDTEQAVRTRRATLGEAARQGWTVAGAHIEGFRTVREAGGGWEML